MWMRQWVVMQPKPVLQHVMAHAGRRPLARGASPIRRLSRAGKIPCFPGDQFSALSRRELVTAVVATLAPLRTMIRLAPALRPVRLGPVLPPTMLARRMLTRLVLPRRPRCIWEINKVQLDRPAWSSVRQLPLALEQNCVRPPRSQAPNATALTLVSARRP